MFSRTTVLVIIATLAYLGFSAMLASSIITHTNSAKDHLNQQTNVLNFENRLLDSSAWLSPDKEWTRVREVADQNAAQALSERAEARTEAVWVALLSLAYLVLLFCLDRVGRHQWRTTSFALIIVAVICLSIGVSAPILEIGAFIDDLKVPVEYEIFGQTISHEFSFEGRIYFYYQCKSVIELIRILFQENNYIVGVSIFCFSILIPFLKLGISLSMLLRRKPKRIHPINRLALVIGKWSMADVFVAGTFLAFLAFNNMNTGIRTESQTLLGLYYFFSFVIVSVLSSYSVERHFRTKLPVAAANASTSVGTRA